MEILPTRNHFTECIRCGSCCKKGGPSFHNADRHLIEKGVIQLKYLYTIRQGEPAYDNIRRCLVAAENDIVKIKEQEKSRVCIFFDETENGCRIYENRPSECRKLKCWDTRELERIYDKERLSREELISGIQGLWDLVSDHQARCDYKNIENLLNKLDKSNQKDAFDTILYMIEYDIQLRSLIIERGAIDPEMVDFLLGLPLVDTIARFGLSVKKKGGAFQLKPSVKPSDFLLRKIE